jgi:hypothetical protein
VSVGDLLEKVVILKTEKLDEGEEMPYDLASKEEFLLSAQRFARIHIGEDSVYLAPRPPRGGPRGQGGEDSVPGEDGAMSGRPRRRGGKARSPPVDGEGAEASSPRRRRPMGTPQEPREISLPVDANDSTVIAHLVYKCVAICFVCVWINVIVWGRGRHQHIVMH